MIEMEKILDQAMEKDASDVHLISGNKPMLRIRRDLIEADDSEELTDDDMYEVYDYFIRGNIEKDEV